MAKGTIYMDLSFAGHPVYRIGRNYYYVSSFHNKLDAALKKKTWFEGEGLKTKIRKIQNRHAVLILMQGDKDKKVRAKLALMRK